MEHTRDYNSNAEPALAEAIPARQVRPVILQHMQPLPLIKGSPPLKLHVYPNAKPVAVHVPPQVPLHWQVLLMAGLARDCRLGVLERVPVNTPATWQS